MARFGVVVFHRWREHEAPRKTPKVINLIASVKDAAVPRPAEQVAGDHADSRVVDR